ncbi:hypothetical protein CBL_13658 [Carabus blaptoides fortunei]
MSTLMMPAPTMTTMTNPGPIPVSQTKLEPNGKITLNNHNTTINKSDENRMDIYSFVFIGTTISLTLVAWLSVVVVHFSGRAYVRMHLAMRSVSTVLLCAVAYEPKRVQIILEGLLSISGDGSTAGCCVTLTPDWRPRHATPRHYKPEKTGPRFRHRRSTRRRRPLAVPRAYFLIHTDGASSLNLSMTLRNDAERLPQLDRNSVAYVCLLTTSTVSLSISLNKYLLSNNAITNITSARLKTMRNIT